jgi:hypothetical protein
MKMLEHSASGATLQFDERELLMLMALVQEGRISFECEGSTGQAIDDLVSGAVRQVMLARGKAFWGAFQGKDGAMAGALISN